MASAAASYVREERDGEVYHIAYGHAWAPDSQHAWKEKVDKKSGKVYFVNQGTKDKKWSLPPTSAGGAAKSPAFVATSSSALSSALSPFATPSPFGSDLSGQAASKSTSSGTPAGAKKKKVTKKKSKHADDAPQEKGGGETFPVGDAGGGGTDSDASDAETQSKTKDDRHDLFGAEAIDHHDVLSPNRSSLAPSSPRVAPASLVATPSAATKASSGKKKKQTTRPEGDADGGTGAASDTSPSVSSKKKKSSSKKPKEAADGSATKAAPLVEGDENVVKTKAKKKSSVSSAKRQKKENGDSEAASPASPSAQSRSDSDSAGSGDEDDDGGRSPNHATTTSRDDDSSSGDDADVGPEASQKQPTQKIAIPNPFSPTASLRLGQPQNQPSFGEGASFSVSTDPPAAATPSGPPSVRSRRVSFVDNGPPSAAGSMTPTAALWTNMMRVEHDDTIDDSTMTIASSSPTPTMDTTMTLTSALDRSEAKEEDSREATDGTREIEDKSLRDTAAETAPSSAVLTPSVIPRLTHTSIPSSSRTAAPTYLLPAAVSIQRGASDPFVLMDDEVQPSSPYNTNNRQRLGSAVAGLINVDESSSWLSPSSSFIASHLDHLASAPRGEFTQKTQLLGVEPDTSGLGEYLPDDSAATNFIRLSRRVGMSPGDEPRAPPDAESQWGLQSRRPEPLDPQLIRSPPLAYPPSQLSTSTQGAFQADEAEAVHFVNSATTFGTRRRAMPLVVADDPPIRVSSHSSSATAATQPLPFTMIAHDGGGKEAGSFHNPHPYANVDGLDHAEAPHRSMLANSNKRLEPQLMEDDEFHPSPVPTSKGRSAALPPALAALLEGVNDRRKHVANEETIRASEKRDDAASRIPPDRTPYDAMRESSETYRLISGDGGGRSTATARAAANVTTTPPKQPPSSSTTNKSPLQVTTKRPATSASPPLGTSSHAAPLVATARRPSTTTSSTRMVERRAPFVQTTSRYPSTFSPVPIASHRDPALADSSNSREPHPQSRGVSPSPRPAAAGSAPTSQLQHSDRVSTSSSSRSRQRGFGSLDVVEQTFVSSPTKRDDKLQQLRRLQTTPPAPPRIVNAIPVVMPPPESAAAAMSPPPSQGYYYPPGGVAAFPPHFPPASYPPQWPASYPPQWPASYPPQWPASYPYFGSPFVVGGGHPYFSSPPPPSHAFPTSPTYSPYPAPQGMPNYYHGHPVNAPPPGPSPAVARQPTHHRDSYSDRRNQREEPGPWDRHHDVDDDDRRDEMLSRAIHDPHRRGRVEDPWGPPLNPWGPPLNRRKEDTDEFAHSDWYEVSKRETESFLSTAERRELEYLRMKLKVTAAHKDDTIAQLAADDLRLSNRLEGAALRSRERRTFHPQAAEASRMGHYETIPPSLQHDRAADWEASSGNRAESEDEAEKYHGGTRRISRSPVPTRPATYSTLQMGSTRSPPSRRLETYHQRRPPAATGTHRTKSPTTNQATLQSKWNSYFERVLL